MVRRSRRAKIAAPSALDPECIIPRGLVLCQPAATFVVQGVWPILPLKFGTDYRGGLYIMAGVRWDEYNRAVCNARPYRDALLRLGYGRRNPLPLGSLVGHVRVETCECHPLSENREHEETDNIYAYRMYYGSRYMRNYYWHFGLPGVVGPPIPCEGGLGLFRLDADLAARARGEASEPQGPAYTFIPADTVIRLGMSLNERKT